MDGHVEAAGERFETQGAEDRHAAENIVAGEPGAKLGAGIRQHVPAIAAGAVILGVVAGAVLMFRSSDSLPPPVKVHELTVVKILPPPPPPPPPPPNQKMVDQTPVKEEFQEQKPVEQPKEPPKDEPKPLKEAKAEEPPPGPLSLDAKATGPGDAFGLGGKPGGRGFIGGNGGGGSRWGWYAALVQTQIETALRANAHTRSAVMQMQVRLWADSSGRVSRVKIVSSSGSAEIDAAIQNEVLSSITLREPPPTDMPMPIVMRITTRRAS